MRKKFFWEKIWPESQLNPTPPSESSTPTPNDDILNKVLDHLDAYQLISNLDEVKNYRNNYTEAINSAEHDWDTLQYYGMFKHWNQELGENLVDDDF